MASKNDIIKLVVSQTNYTNKEAEKKLQEHDYNYVMVVKEYLNPSINKTEKREPEKNRSLNEQMMDEIRGFMDIANREYLIRKEQEKKNKLIQQQMYEQYLQQIKEKEIEKKEIEKKEEESDEKKEIEKDNNANNNESKKTD